MDTLGLVLAVLVTRADVSDAQGARWLLGELEGFCKKLRRIWGDGGYRGELMQWGGRRDSSSVSCRCFAMTRLLACGA